jgi:methyl-accepting chemotaxis protein
VQVINKKMKNLSERILEIGTISKLISDIATRTTILAMNASIEASRAGEQGRGFLVISDEIKRLADKSAEATKQINGVIKSIQTDAGEVTASLEEETKTVESQTRLAQDTGDAFNSIKDAIEKSKSVVTEISELSKAQLEITKNVDEAMLRVVEISQIAQRHVEDSSKITTGLNKQSSELLLSVDTFRLPED